MGEPIIISLIQHFEADFLWQVSLKILNSGIILKTFTCEDRVIENYFSYFLNQTIFFVYLIESRIWQRLTKYTSLEAIFSADEINLSNLGIRSTNDHLCQVSSKSAPKSLQRFFIRSTTDHLCQVISKSAPKSLQRFFIRSTNDHLCQVIFKSTPKSLQRSFYKVN